MYSDRATITPRSHDLASPVIMQPAFDQPGALCSSDYMTTAAAACTRIMQHACYTELLTKTHTYIYLHSMNSMNCNMRYQHQNRHESRANAYTLASRGGGSGHGDIEAFHGVQRFAVRPAKAACVVSVFAPAPNPQCLTLFVILSQ